jgi:(E)-4-hydroxy-3-methylbut-2-enyl-diphosphate synthase
VDERSLESAEALVLAAERELAVFEDFGFSGVLVSMKASSVADTIKANRMMAERSDVPLHIGVTEAGPLIAGVVRNTAALVALLGEGIGDTIRVSLSDTMEKEVIAGREILAAAGEMRVAEGAGRGAANAAGFAAGLAALAWAGRGARAADSDLARGRIPEIAAFPSRSEKERRSFHMV